MRAAVQPIAPDSSAPALPDVTAEPAARLRNLLWRIRIGSCAAFVLCAMLQILISPTQTNMLIAIIAAASGVVSFSYAIRPDAFQRFPISTLMIVGLNVSTTSGALVAQTLDWRAIDFNLEAPLTTFLTCTALTFVAIGTHMIYRRALVIQRARFAFSQKFLTRIGLFTTPTNLQLWIMGFVGVAAMASAGTSLAQETIAYGDVGGKFAQALTPFTVAPFLIPFSAYLLGGRPMPKAGWPALIAFFALLIVVALMRNSRGAFAVVFLVIGLGILLAVLSGRLSFGRKQIATGALICLLALPVVPVFYDLATAMVIARSARSNLQPTELVVTTLEIFQNKPALEAKRAEDAVIDGGYNELYIENTFLARFIYTKFADLNFHQASNLSPHDVAYAREVFVNRLLADLPTPILRALRINIDKHNLAFSGGDLYRQLSSRGEVGGYTTGSSAADGIAMFGVLFWPITIVIFLAYFFLFDSLSLPMLPMGVMFTAVVVMQLPTLFPESLMRDSLAAQIGSLTRGFVQSILLYLIFFHASRLLLAAVGGLRHAR